MKTIGAVAKNWLFTFQEHGDSFFFYSMKNHS